LENSSFLFLNTTEEKFPVHRYVPVLTVVAKDLFFRFESPELESYHGKQAMEKSIKTIPIQANLFHL
jgi:hypothetical protein